MSLDPKRTDEIVMPVNPANVPVSSSSRAECEPQCLTESLLVTSHQSSLDGRRHDEQLVLQGVHSWFARIGMEVSMQGHRVVGEYRDMVAEFCYMLTSSVGGGLRQRLDSGNGNVTETRSLIVSLNNSKISEPTPGTIKDLRHLVRHPMLWNAKADFRERARCHKRLTGLNLEMDNDLLTAILAATRQDKENSVWNKSDGFELNPKRWTVHMDEPKQAHPSKSAIARLYGIKP